LAGSLSSGAIVFPFSLAALAVGPGQGVGFDMTKPRRQGKRQVTALGSNPRASSMFCNAAATRKSRKE
jgi:hypothetical protein